MVGKIAAEAGLTLLCVSMSAGVCVCGGGEGGGG